QSEFYDNADPLDELRNYMVQSSSRKSPGNIARLFHDRPSNHRLYASRRIERQPLRRLLRHWNERIPQRISQYHDNEINRRRNIIPPPHSGGSDSPAANLRQPR